MKLNPPDTAPKDGSGILISFNNKPITQAFWSKANEKWNVAFCQHGRFTNIRIRHERLTGWLPLTTKET